VTRTPNWRWRSREMSLLVSRTPTPVVGCVALGFEGELDRDRGGGGAEEVVADGVAPGAGDVDPVYLGIAAAHQVGGASPAGKAARPSRRGRHHRRLATGSDNPEPRFSGPR
jgi:hypothetical protein